MGDREGWLKSLPKDQVFTYSDHVERDFEGALIKDKKAVVINSAKLSNKQIMDVFFNVGSSKTLEKAWIQDIEVTDEPINMLTMGTYDSFLF